MRMSARVEVWLPGHEVTRAPSFFESFLAMFGAKPDLRTGEQQLAWNALGLVEALGHLLGNVGVHDAVMLLLDEQVVWRLSLIHISEPTRPY